MAGLDEKYGVSENFKSSVFNRSLTTNSSSNDFIRRPYLHSQIERNGSTKKTHNSSLGSVGNPNKGKVKRLCSLFESRKRTDSVPEAPQFSTQLPSPSKWKSAKSFGSDFRVSPSSDDYSIRLPGSEDRVVVYLTSLRGIRRTFEDCYAVRMILRGFRIIVDERDISMDSAYKKELQSVLGEKSVTLPQVFVRGKYIGGADKIKQLFETGDLAKILKGLPVRGPGYVCDVCGDGRFIPCCNCNGSKKVFDEDDEQLKRCPECNENGLIRCPTCCS